MTDIVRQELQTLRDEVTRLRISVICLCTVAINISIFAFIPIVTAFCFDEKRDWHAMAESSSRGVAIASLFFWPLLFFILWKTRSPTGANYPSPGQRPGYPDKNDAKP